MELMIFSIYDNAAKAFLQPFFAPTVEAAIRMARSVVSDPNHQFAKYPEDYTLFEIGLFDQGDGSITAAAAPHSVAPLITLVPEHPHAESPQLTLTNTESA